MSSLSPPLSSPNSAPSQANLADALDENAHLWKRVHALQERAHSMCAENVDLRRQVNILRSRAKAIAPSLSVDTSASVSGLPPSPVPSPHEPPTNASFGHYVYVRATRVEEGCRATPGRQFAPP
ncbi:hypothetical protein CcaverHIS002_0704740 [Cutaneotrichosporon cavernicola]|nr:hypothetical protein CcaverHIS002_0704740 [Cutaneotrichosporon cavernicola]